MSESTGGKSHESWEQFLIGKQRMLASYDQAKSHSKYFRVQVHHGITAEAVFREWLASFLPKRYGVTSGYIRPQGFAYEHAYSHFDVIIYDQLNAPILWVDRMSDRSESGQSRIIPAEHVLAVLEVKSNLTRQTISDAALKLRQLEPLMKDDEPDARYPTYLPSQAVVGMIFFQLQQKVFNDLTILETIRDMATLPRTFYGAVILSAEGRDVDDSGRIHPIRGDNPLQETEGASLMFGMCDSIEFEGNYFAALALWHHEIFSQFAFDLLALLNKTYKPGFLSSFYGKDWSKIT